MQRMHAAQVWLDVFFCCEPIGLGGLEMSVLGGAAAVQGPWML